MSIRRAVGAPETSRVSAACRCCGVMWPDATAATVHRVDLEPHAGRRAIGARAHDAPYVPFPQRRATRSLTVGNARRVAYAVLCSSTISRRCKAGGISKRRSASAALETTEEPRATPSEWERRGREDVSRGSIPRADDTRARRGSGPRAARDALERGPRAGAAPEIVSCRHSERAHRP